MLQFRLQKFVLFSVDYGTLPLMEIGIFFALAIVRDGFGESIKFSMQQNPKQSRNLFQPH